MPAGQLVHDADAFAVLNVPGAHSTQLVWPVDAAYVPTIQASHEGAATCGDAVPTAQGVQLDDAGGAYVPAPHASLQDG